ncbi:hypothetical protein B0J11DRAFT_434661 [Dendryphion nanum]|uniref:NAD(P)-binding protein n=1 Tax=Dendryphion nanum TaxID=256645 RepID=A0A9P9ILV3_9PLEO|nr:hypothetical protein B0J11DRAFT_434661 [Dendryphion nanum]
MDLSGLQLEEKEWKVQEQDLRGKIALVTGATKGIGRAIALNLATRGASILGTYSSPSSSPLFDHLSATITSLYTRSSHPTPTLLGIPADISSPTAPSTILSALRTHFDNVPLSIVIFNAAIMGLAKTGSGTITEDFVTKALAGNVMFPVLLMEELVKGAFLQPNSRIVAISSEGVRAWRPSGGAVYAATKAALECLMRKWADELGTRPGMEGTTFNSVSVGFTKTDAYTRIPASVREELTARDAAEVAVGNRIGEVEDVADVVGLLVSEKARWISGSVMDASGGKAKIM